jgi:2'-5' RNA ligase
VLPRWRLFLAAPVPERSTDEIWSALEYLRERYPSVRWAKRDQLHATLVFLGQTEPPQVGRLAAAIDVIAATHHSFEVTTGEAGGRIDDRRTGVAWLSIDAGRRELAELSLALDREIGSDTYHGHPPRPHITVARRIDQALLDDLRASAPAMRLGWPIDRIVLMRSHPDPGGSRYETLTERLLTGPSVSP